MQGTWNRKKGGQVMQVFVFNFPNESVDIVSVDKEYVETIYSGDTEAFLVEEVGYDPDNICFMSDVKSVQLIDKDSLSTIN